MLRALSAGGDAMESNKSRYVRRIFLTALGIIALGISYPLSLGPVRCVAPVLDHLYIPVFFALDYLPEPVGNLYAEYLSYWNGDDILLEDLRWSNM